MPGNLAVMHPRGRGFTLIEVLVALGIMAFLLLMAMPSINTYLLDTRIRVTAQSYYDGAQLARTEALRRNADVAITLNNSNRGWSVNSGGGSIAAKPAEAAEKLTVKADAATVTFNALGAASADNTVQFLPVNENTCIAAGGAQRCLNVLVSRGGQVRLCDPSFTTAGDNRKC